MSVGEDGIEQGECSLSFEVLGKIIDNNRDRLTNVRLSIGVQAEMHVKDPETGNDMLVLLVNKKRLSKGIAVYGPIGGSVEFADDIAKKTIMSQFDLKDEQFEADKPRDVRISHVAVSQVGELVEALTDTNIVEYPDVILKELRQELQEEMESLSSLSGGIFNVNNYRGDFPSLNDVSYKRQVVFPLQNSVRDTSGRADSLRVQALYTVTMPPELQQYILQNGTTLEAARAQGFINTPFMLITEEEARQIAGEFVKFIQLGQESMSVNGVVFGMLMRGSDDMLKRKKGITAATKEVEFSSLLWMFK